MKSIEIIKNNFTAKTLKMEDMKVINSIDASIRRINKI